MRSKTPFKTEQEPTKTELDILQVLWQHGPSTVRFVNEELSRKKETTYTATLKLMQVMYAKGLLKRDDSSMKHVYSAAAEEQVMKRYLLQKFVDSLYNGSASGLMMQLLGDRKVSQKEINDIKKMLADLDEK